MNLANVLVRSPVVAALTAPHGVDRYLEIINPMWAAHDVRAHIVDLHQETPAAAQAGAPPVVTITLQPTATWQGHRAGQHVQVGVDLPGSSKRMTRVFTVSSAESRPGGQITLTMRANPDGQVSQHLATRAKVGDIVHLSQALGEFTLPEPTPTHLVFISGGSGITPVMSMVRTLLRRGYGGTITFVHYAQSPDHQIYARELAELPPNVHRHLIYPECGDDFFSAAALSRIVPNFQDVDSWACGPGGLIELIQDAYGESDRLRVEYFKPPATQRGTSGGALSFSRSGVTADNDGASILEQAEAAGLKPEFGCRMGICFSCTATKREGVVRNVLTGEESDLPDEQIRVCVSTPVGDCAVDL